MQVCPNCGTAPEAGATACQFCGQQLKRSWLRRFLDAFAGDRAPSGPPPPATDAASGEAGRLRLFEEWLEYGLGREEGFVVFESGRDCYVQYMFGPQSSEAYAEVGTSTWEEIFGEPMPGLVAERLLQRGFHAPDRDHDINYWQNHNETDPRSLAELTEWSFREIFGEDENFTGKVANFE